MPIIFNQFVSYTVSGFNHLIFLGLINIFTGAFIILWFTDFFFIQEQLNCTGINLDSFDTTINYILSPQIDFTFSMDEIRVTLILGFFLIGESEAADDEDFILSTEGELNVIEEVVAPLFVANLGKDIAENGSLYLKVCSIFSFVLISNLLGMIPYGDTATSSLILTF
jgi:F0F1-type ATP synthase membrane subunit a